MSKTEYDLKAVCIQPMTYPNKSDVNADIPSAA